MTRRHALASACLLALALSGCGGSSDTTASPTPTPSPTVSPTGAPATAEQFAAIKASWEGFFRAGGTVESHTSLLEDGDQFTAELTKAAKDPAAQGLKATLLTASVSGERADVTYDLVSGAGVTVLPGAQGVAVQQNGSWKVSKATYCTLVALQDPGPHPGCG